MDLLYSWRISYITTSQEDIDYILDLEEELLLRSKPFKHKIHCNIFAAPKSLINAVEEFLFGEGEDDNSKKIITFHGVSHKIWH